MSAKIFTEKTRQEGCLEKIKIYNVKKSAEPKSTKACTSRYTGFWVLPATCSIYPVYIRMFRHIVRNINANV